MWESTKALTISIAFVIIIGGMLVAIPIMGMVLTVIATIALVLFFYSDYKMSKEEDDD